MSDERTEQDFREDIERFTQPGAENMFVIMFENLPRYIGHLQTIRSGIAGLEEILEPCSCGEPDCLAAPQHMTLWEEPFKDALDRLKVAEEEMREAVVGMCWSLHICSCLACRTRGQRENSVFN